MTHCRYGRSVSQPQESSTYQPRIGRIPIRLLSPRQPDDLWPSKAYAGEVVPFEATVFKEGHDLIGVEAVLTAPDGTRSTHRMIETNPGTDRWRADVLLEATGLWQFQVQAWVDEWATWLHDATLKIPAGVDVALMLASGSELLARALKRTPRNRTLAEAATTSGSRRSPRPR